jgi:hypothetical protein
MLRVEQEAQPIWMAVLLATRCQAVGNGRERAVRWEWVAGRAIYTNTAGDAELIQPLGVRLRDGYALAVFWAPGETAYTMEVYRQNNLGLRSPAAEELKGNRWN